MSATNALTSTHNDDSDAYPTPSNALYVVPRERGDGFRASIRGHIFDLPDPSSGYALVPTPDDLFILSIAAEFAWSARRFLRANGLPEDVSVSANWRTPDDLPSLAHIDLTVTVSRAAEAVSAALATAFENRLAARCRAEPVVHISLEGAAGGGSA